MVSGKSCMSPYMGRSLSTDRRGSIAAAYLEGVRLHRGGPEVAVGARQEVPDRPVGARLDVRGHGQVAVLEAVVVGHRAVAVRGGDGRDVRLVGGGGAVEVQDDVTLVLQG